MRTVFRLAAVALAVFSAGCFGSSGGQGGQLQLTSANLVRAMRAHGFTDLKAFPAADTVLACPALERLPGSSINGGHGRFQAMGVLNVKPQNLPQDTARTGAVLAVVQSPTIAARCARQLLDSDRPQYSKALSDDMIEAPSTGGAGSEPLEQGGVVTDGSYEIIGSQGRIILIGLARNRPDADQVEHDLRTAAQSFR